MASHLLNSSAGVPGLVLLYLIKGALTTGPVKSTYCETLNIHLGSAALKEVRGHLLFEPTLAPWPITLGGSQQSGEWESGRRRGRQRVPRSWDRLATNHCRLWAAGSFGVWSPLLIPLHK